MSNSVFREYPSEDKSDVSLDEKNQKVDSNLVIVVNKDGSVSVDQNTLKSVLADETSNTSVSVIRVSSPTPSIEDEIEQERKQREFNMLDDQESEQHNDSQLLSTNSINDDVPHVSITVEGFYPPGEEAKRFATEVLSLAGLQHPLKIETIDYEFQKYVIQNDHCYTPLTSPSQRLPKPSFDDEIPVHEIMKPVPKSSTEEPSQPIVKKKPKLITSAKKVSKKSAEAESEQDTDSNSIKETVDETDSDYTEDTPTSSEDDHDSDLDFSVTHNRRKNRRPGRGGNRSILKGSRIIRKKSSTVTDNDVENMVREIESAHEKSMRKKAMKQHHSSARKSSSKHGHKSSKSSTKKEGESVASTSAAVTTTVVSPKPEPVKETLPPPHHSVKKEKKSSAHMEALFSDMSSLFSTPDIIKKVGNKQENVHQTLLTHTKGFVPLCPSTAKNSKIPGQISIQTHPSSAELNSSSSNVDLLDSLVQTKQEKQEIFDIVKTLEGPLDSSMMSNASSHMGDSSMLDNTDDQNSILDDGLPEDLLQHVAELAENKEIQEIIDKQVLGVMSTNSNLNQSLNSPLDVSSSSLSVPLHNQPEQIKRISPPTMSVKEQLMPRKEPIQIRRSDGRIITLPPIEAPATRGAAKRKAQVTTPVPEKPVVVKEPQIKTSVITMPTPVKAKDTHKTPDGSKSGSRRNSGAANKSTTEGKHRKSTSGVTSVLAALDAEDDIDSDESWNSEDDPDRLWCICKQPHNNRFMICCDSCEDWFHGKCVNVTKQMGQQMEEEGIEWTCPNCLPKKGGKQQTKLTDFMMKAAVGGSSSLVPKQIHLTCIVCKKPSRPNSIYCSDDCIRKHAQNATKSAVTGKIDHKKPESSKNEAIIVIDKKTGRYISGKNAPTMDNLKQWLRDNPTYEVVEKGSAQAIAIKAKQMQLKQLSKDMNAKEGSSSPQPNKIQTTIKFNEQRKLVYSSPAGKSPKTPVGKSSPSPSTSATKKDKEPPKPVPKKPRTTSESKPTTPTAKQSGESIRDTCRTHMKEQIKQRLNEGEVSSKLSDSEIENFVREVEREMFIYFSRDTGIKYKAKYRSLIFNIKDRKNKSLFQKICDKSIEPKQLVHMTPEEMASQELTQWRVNENKHQLEMIKKSELDLLAASKNYVLKTHKGEEVMEDNKMKRVELDPTTSVEDVVTVLNNSTVSSTTEVESTTEFAGKHKEYDLTYGKSYGLTPSSSSSSANVINAILIKRKEMRRSRSRSRDRTKSASKHKRKRSRERSRDRERRDHKREDKKEDKKYDKKKEHHSSHHHSHHHDSSRDHSSLKEKDQDKITMFSKQIKEEKKLIKKEIKKETRPKIETFSLVDQILEASSSGVKMECHQEIKQEKKDSPQSTKLEDKPHRISSDQEQEPTSTVTIPTPPHSTSGFDNEELEHPSASPEPVSTPTVLWSGNVHYIDVATFEITVENVSGDCEETFTDFPEEMDICGTIKPEIVWDYIEQIKKSPNKEICVVRITSFDSTAYETLYHHLHLRRRFCVIKPTSSQIKDFYLFSLPAERSFPAILLPINGPGLVEGESKPDLLLGVIIKIKGKRHATTVDSSHLNKAKKLAHSAVKQIPQTKNYSTKVDENFTPPSSPKASRKLESKSKLMLGLPADLESDSNSDEKKRKADSLEADDEPYSPADSDENLTDLSEIIHPSKKKRKSTNDMDSLRLQKEMEELNRQIAEEKNKIVGIIKKSDIDEKTLPTSLIGIALPSNLKDILKSINIGGSSKVETPISEDNTVNDDDEEYVPECPSSSLLGYKSGFSYTATSTSAVETPPRDSTSKLATLTDEELLRMVPDDAKIPLPDDSPMEIVEDKDFDEDDEDHFEDVDEIKGVTNSGGLNTASEETHQDDLKLTEIIDEGKEMEKSKNEESDHEMTSPPSKKPKWMDSDEPLPPGIDEFDDDDIL